MEAGAGAGGNRRNGLLSVPYDPSVNHVTLIGRCTSAPVPAALDDGGTAHSAVFELTTVSRSWSGARVPEVHRIVAFGDAADIVLEHVEEGALLYVSGGLVSSGLGTRIKANSVHTLRPRKEGS